MPAARKVVTVLFADLTGSTALEEKMDAESVRSILDRFYAMLRTETERLGGRVVKFTGDGVMAVFGVPDVREDDAARAVDAALAMRTECAHLSADLGIDLAIKIGVNTGEVVVSETDADVVGDCVNVAARLEGAAVSGEVLVGEETWRLTRGTSRYEAIDPLTLKGKSEPVPAYRLLAVDERTADSAAAPFVGRQAELARLAAVFDEAVTNKQARLVTIVGSPGLGKTRLARELAAHVADRASVLETRCDPRGTATFAPIAEALRGSIGLTESASSEEILATIAALLPPDEPEREKIAERAAAILGVGLPGTTEETFWSLRRLIEAAAAVRPLVLVLEDLHWAEPLLLDLVEHLAEWTKDAPVLLVGTGRPELRDMRPSFVEGGRRASAVVALEGLDDVATRQLAMNLLGTDDVPRALLARIPASTDGNPLFVRELVRMLVDDGVLLRTGDGWTVTVDVEAIQVPPTIQSLLAARVDRLRNDERTVLELAAVIGKEFYPGAVADLAPPAMSHLVDGCLESLRRKELVEPAGTYWIDEPVYRFHHALIRDAAYRRILKESRAELHEAAALWLGSKTVDVLGEHEELVGYHLEQASSYKQQLGRPVTDLARRAADLLGQAARRALDRDDLPAAAALSVRVLELLEPDEPSRAEILILRCEALLSMGEVAAGMDAIDELDGLATDQRIAAWTTCFVGQLANLKSPERLQETEKFVRAAAAQLVDLEDQAGAAKAHTVHATTLARLGRFAECEAALDLGLTAARAAADHRRITAALGSAPHAALWGPSPVSRAGGRCLDVVRLLRITTGSPAVEATSLRCQAVLEAFRGRAEPARRMLRSARRTLTELGLEHELLEAEQFAGIVELLAGDPAAAEKHLRMAYEGFRAVGVDVLAAQSAALLARTQLSLGDIDEASRFAEESEALGGQDLKASIAWRAVKAELFARRGRFDEAKRLAETAIEIAERTDALIDHGDACRALSVVCSLAGDPGGARTADRRAVALYERKGATALTGTSEPAEQPDPQRAATSERLTNACTRVVDRWSQHVAARDWDAFARLWTEGCEVDDRRTGFHHVLRGREAQVDTTRMITELGVERIDRKTIAIRDETFALTELTFVGTSADGGGYEVQALALTELDDAGRCASVVFFDPDDLRGAIADLDRRFIADKDDAYLTPLESLRALNARDWDRLRSLLADDIVVVDHRPASLGELRGADGYVAAVRQLIDVIPDLFIYAAAVARMRAGIGIGECLGRGSTLEGGPVETAFLSISVHDAASGKTVRMEWFPLDRAEEAHARVEQLISAASAEPEAPGVADISSAPAERGLTNTASRAQVRSHELLVQRDWATLGTLYDDATTSLDCRAGLQLALTGREALVANLKAMVDVGVRKVDSEVIAIRGDSLALHKNRFTGSDASTFETEALLLTETNASGRFVCAWTFDLEDLDEAMSLLDERHTELTASSTLENAATRLGRRFHDCYDRRDWDGLAALFSPDSALDDRRKGMQLRVVGRDVRVTNMAEMARVGAARVVTSPIALRGDRLAIHHFFISGPEDDGFSAELLQLDELDDDGLLAESILFDVGDLTAALEELEGRYLDTLLPEERVAWHAVVTTVAAYDRHDWEAFRDSLTSDFVVIDHRPAYLGAIERDALIESLIAQVRLVPDLRVIPKTVHRIDPRAVLYVPASSGTTADGGRIEISFFALAMIRDDRTERIEFFPLEAEAAAVARFEEVTRALHPAAGPAELENAASRLEALATEALRDGDWTRAESLFASDVLVDDRRTGVASTGRGSAAWVRNFRTVRELGFQPAKRLVLAVRDEQLALCLGELVDGDGNTIGGLVLIEMDDSGIVAIVFFDVDDVDSAYEELDRRWLAKVGPLRAATATLDLVDSYNTRDWERLRSLLSDDLVVTDHQLVVGGTSSGSDGLLDYMKPLLDLAPDTRMAVVRPIFVDERGGVSLVAVTGHSTDGGPIEFEYISIGTLDDAGRFSHIEIFPAEAEWKALERYEELRGLYPAGPENAALLRSKEGTRAAAAGDWDAFRAVLHPDAVLEDRRSGLAVQARGSDEITRQLQIATPPGLATRNEVIALRGEDLALFRCVRAPQGFEIAWLNLTELAEDGSIVHNVMFDESDREAAFAELEHRYARRQTSQTNSCTRVMDRVTVAHRQQDWTAVGACFAERVVIEDRRPGLRNRVDGRDAAVQNLQELAGLGGDGWEDVEVMTHGDRRALYRRRLTPIAGANVEVEILDLGEIDSDGLICRGVHFETSDRAAAVAELNRPDHRLTNECVDVLERARAAFEAKDRSRMAPDVAEDIRVEDRRSGLRNESVGWEAYAEEMEAMWSIGARNLRFDVLAVRGERLALSRQVVGPPDGFRFHTELLSVDELNEDGRASARIFFDVDDLGAALAELDERYLAGEGSSWSEIWNVQLERLDAMNRRDWDRYRAIHHPDLTVVDHRSVGLGRIEGFEEFLRFVRRLEEVAPDLRRWAGRIEAIDTDRVLVLFCGRGTTSAGADVELVNYDLMSVRDGRIARIEMFDEQARDAALARFEELAGREVSE